MLPRSVGGITQIINLGKRGKMGAICAKLKGLIKHFRSKGNAYIRDHLVVEIGQNLLPPIGAETFQAKISAIARIDHIVHVFGLPVAYLRFNRYRPQ